MAHSLSSNDDTPRDIGSVEFSNADVATQLLKAGWAKLKEIKREPTEADLKKREAEAEAKAAGKGIWNPHGPKVRFSHDLLRMLTYPPSHNAGSCGTLHDAGRLSGLHHRMEGQSY